MEFTNSPLPRLHLHVICINPVPPSTLPSQPNSPTSSSRAHLPDTHLRSSSSSAPYPSRRPASPRPRRIPRPRPSLLEKERRILPQLPRYSVPGGRRGAERGEVGAAARSYEPAVRN